GDSKPAATSISGNLFTRAGAIRPKLQSFLTLTAASVKSQKARVTVRLPRNALTATARAAIVRKQLVAAGLTDVEARSENRRGTPTVTITVEPPPAPPRAAPVARVMVGGRPASLDGRGHFQLHATEPPGAPVVLDATSAEGHRAVYIVQPPVATAR